MALDSIVVGADWTALITVAPTDGESNSDVTSYLTGATVTALLTTGGTTAATASGAVASAANRTVRLTLTDTQTSGLTQGVHRWNVTVTTSGGLVYPLDVGDTRVVNVL